MKFNQILQNFEKKEYLQQLFEKAGFFIDKEDKTCSFCNLGVYKRVKYKGSPIGIYLRCSHLPCKKVKSIFENSALKNVKISSFLTILLSFIAKKKIATVIADNDIDEKTVYTLFKYFRSVCANNLTNIIKIGGPGKTVEIDETHLFKRKYHRGRKLISEDIWVFGMFERGSKRVYVESIIRRDAETLYNIVRQHVLPGTTIVTDGWRGYSLIKNEFITKTVIHKEYFVDPDDKFIHTNNIERLWRSLKEELRGCSNDSYPVHLKVFMFRREWLKDNL